MNQPKIKIFAVSNVYCRLMEFEKEGDIELGHKHLYDHATLLSKGSLKVEMLDELDHVVSEKIFQSPSFIFIAKNVKHKLISLENETIACCIHALKDIDENIIPSDTLVEEKVFKEINAPLNISLNEFFKTHDINIGKIINS
jgi:hypothetical protein